MDFTFTDEQRALRDAARELAGRHAPSYQKGSIVVGPHPHDAKTWAALAELGALGLPFRSELGGMGAGPVECGIVAAELGRAGVVTAYPNTLVALQVLADAASPLLADATDGTALVLPALDEPGQAWSPARTSVTATGGGDTWELTGTKEPVPDADAATHLIVPATTPDGAALFLVDAGGATAHRLRLQRTPASMLIGPEHAEAALRRAVALGIATLCAEALGAMDQAVSMTVEYLKSRKQFGVPLMTFQTLTQRAADMYVSLELARSVTWFTAMQLAEQPDDWAAAERAKVLVDRTARHIGQEAIQLHGGIAMTAEYPVGHLTTRLTAIAHTFGDRRTHLESLAAGLREHEALDVLG